MLAVAVQFGLSYMTRDVAVIVIENKIGCWMLTYDCFAKEPFRFMLYIIGKCLTKGFKKYFMYRYNCLYDVLLKLFEIFCKRSCILRLIRIEW